MRLYRLSMHYRIGRHVLIGFLGALLAMPFISPQLHRVPDVSLEGTLVRTNSRVFGRYLKDIKANDGLLILGTSETYNYPKENYWALLRNDERMPKAVSCLAGAGRTCTVYFPGMLANPEAYKGLDVLYFINPTYWRSGHNRFEYKYYDRYNSMQVAQGFKSEAKDRGLYEDFLEPYFDHVSDSASFSDRGLVWIDAVQSYFHYDLSNALFPAAPVEKMAHPAPSARAMRQLNNDIDTSKNVTHRYLTKYNNPPMPALDTTLDYQYRALEEFVKLANELDINLVCFLGPYNGIYAQEQNPEVLPIYKENSRQIRSILQQGNIPCIDGEDLSYVPGGFTDIQHHSLYGAWLIEQRILEYYEQQAAQP